MIELDVDGMIFRFPDDWQAVKYDDTQFYRGIFQKVHDGIKAVDLLAIPNAEPEVFLIEVKDYTRPKTHAVKPSELADDVARKVTSTLAGIMAGRLYAENELEASLFQAATSRQKVTVVLHCENPRVPIVDPADLLIALRRRLGRIASQVNVGRRINTTGDWSIE